MWYRQRHIRERIVPQKKTPVWASFFDFSCSGRGRGLPIVPHSRRRRRKRTYIQGAKACFGVGESACGRGIDAACVCGRVLYGAVCIRTLCVHGRCWVFRSLRFTRRSVVAVSPRRPHVHPPCGMVRRCQGAARGWYLNSPHRECLYHVFGSVCGHTQRGRAASSFICT